ncbi:hypothetical protein JTE90_019833 [Oedothorax gibbosus]|uniref:Uncharacterized protein n=1 Tax=Oedothorax gibbosus TaxID=931172 RepID=A0AAV6V5R4_9ARAC|nr:hypothetical protein JTE90_019833 [Oedothorax gibbosus]
MFLRPRAPLRKSTSTRVVKQQSHGTLDKDWTQYCALRNPVHHNCSVCSRGKSRTKGGDRSSMRRSVTCWEWGG